MRAQQSLAAAVLAFTAGALALPGSSYGSGLGAAGTPHVPRVPKRAAADKKGVFMMNRIAPATSELYVANADGTGETLLLSNSSSFDYHGAWSPDGKWVTFSTARNGDGQSDVYRVALSSSSSSSGAAVVAGAPESVVATPSFEDKLVLSPDGAQGAFVSTADGYTANVWVVDLATGAARNLTDTALTRTNVSAATSPRGHFSPAWSPDGQWLVFSSDRATAWTGHSNGSGWEHTQALSVYAVRPDGTGFRQVATNGSEYSCEFRFFGFCLVSYVSLFPRSSSFFLLALFVGLCRVLCGILSFQFRHPCLCADCNPRISACHPLRHARTRKHIVFGLLVWVPSQPRSVETLGGLRRGGEQNMHMNTQTETFMLVYEVHTCTHTHQCR